MSARRENQYDYAFVAVLEKRGKIYTAEAAFGEERSVYIGRKELKGARKGDLVVIEEGGRGRGRITQVLGRADSLDAVMEGILTYYRIPRGFSEKALAETVEGARLAGSKDEGRRDLTGHFTVTIDPDEAKDFDDAISLVAGPGEGEVTLFVHIADVSYFVEAGSVLDREAAKKATSVYLPLGVEPMLPPELSNDVCSLRPDVERKCVSVEMVFATGATGDTLPRVRERGDNQLLRDANNRAETGRIGGEEGLEETGPQAGDLTPVRVHFYRSLIRSRARLTYNQVDDFFSGEASLGEETEALLGACRELAHAMRRARLERGALDIETFEPEYRLDDEGEIVGVRPMPCSESHALIEEFMIAANEAVAEYLERRGLHAIYRIHEEPDPMAVDALFDLMDDLGIATPPFSLKQASPGRAGEAVRELLRMRAHAGSAARDGSFFHETVLRSLKQARYAEDNLGHFGLASAAYLHFTSPIRRYPDLVVHRALLAGLGLSDFHASRFDMSLTAEHSSGNERRAGMVEHMGDDVVLSHLLEQLLFHEGWDSRFEGEVISLIPSGLFVRFGEVYEGFVPARSLRGDYYALNEKGSALIGRRSGRPFRLGDAVTVRVVRIDKLRGKVELERLRS